MNVAGLKKLTYMVNTAILIMVFGLMAFFVFAKAKFLVWFSIPTALVYVIGYILISRGKLYEYVVLVYSWITVYMGICTVCLGYDYGFHLYGMSMIPIIFYTDYMGRKIGGKKVNPFIFSGLIVIFYLISSLIPYIRGPVYMADKSIARVFWVTNSVIVFGFLIFYTNVLIKMTIRTEDTLENMALRDNLTNIPNRHYMMRRLEETDKFESAAYIAMIDIDSFKSINDVYGHNAGDMVLKSLADIMKENCKDFSISRWGGEEFLILITEKGNQKLSDDYLKERMEKLRQSVEDAQLEYEGKDIRITVTIGVAGKDGWPTIEKWVDAADDKLYYGKNNGKNQVVM